MDLLGLSVMSSNDIHVHDGVAVATCGDTVVLVWKAPATLERWEWAQGHVESLSRSAAHGIVVLDVILGSSDPPDAALRARIQTDFRELGDRLRRFIVLPLGTSLWQSIVRTLVRAILLVSGQSRRHVVASTIDEGLERLQEVARAETPPSAQVRRVTDALLQALAAAPSTLRV